MIGLRRTIERGMRHRWLGPLFILLFCVLMALMFMHAIHDGQNAGTELGEFCLAVIIMLGIVLLIRVRFKAPLAVTPVRVGRAPPLQVQAFGRLGPITLCVSPPLRI